MVVLDLSYIVHVSYVCLMWSLLQDYFSDHLLWSIFLYSTRGYKVEHRALPWYEFDTFLQGFEVITAGHLKGNVNTQACSIEHI